MAGSSVCFGVSKIDLAHFEVFEIGNTLKHDLGVCVLGGIKSPSKRDLARRVDMGWMFVAVFCRCLATFDSFPNVPCFLRS